MKTIFLLVLLTGCQASDDPKFPIPTGGGGTSPDASPEPGKTPRSCVVTNIIYHADKTETLNLGYGCGSYGPGPDAVTLTFTRTLDRVKVASNPYSILCGNNSIAFTVEDAFGSETVSEVTGQEFDISCL